MVHAIYDARRRLIRSRLSGIRCGARLVADLSCRDLVACPGRANCARIRRFHSAHMLWTGAEVYPFTCYAREDRSYGRDFRAIQRHPRKIHIYSCDTLPMRLDDDFTLILTRGVHLISQASAERIRLALERREKVVDVLLDPFGDVDRDRMTTIAVGHVVALTRNPPRIVPGAPNVTALRRQRAR